MAIPAIHRNRCGPGEQPKPSPWSQLHVKFFVRLFPKLRLLLHGYHVRTTEFRTDLCRCNKYVTYVGHIPRACPVDHLFCRAGIPLNLRGDQICWNYPD